MPLTSDDLPKQKVLVDGKLEEGFSYPVSRYWKDAMDSAVSNDLGFFRMMWEKGGLRPEESKYTMWAAILGHTEMLAWLLEHECPNELTHVVHSTTRESACSLAAGLNNLYCLDYLHTHGYPWDKEVTMAAAARSLECLEYLYDHDCPWDETACHAAVQYGNLECLQFLHANGCPWDQDTVEYAVRGGETRCLAYLLHHGCPYDPSSPYAPILQEWIDAKNT